MMINFKALAISFCLCWGSGIYAQKYTGVEDKKQHRFAYLEMNGEFKMDKRDSLTINDRRNPSRILLSTSHEAGTFTEMTFYKHLDEEKIWAKCIYQYIGSRPDPYYFPNTSKTSIWDIFEKVGDGYGECSKFQYVISRSPHDMPVHMHLRYGDNVEMLLNMSKDKKDDSFNPWWAEYLKVDK